MPRTNGAIQLSEHPPCKWTVSLELLMQAPHCRFSEHQWSHYRWSYQKLVPPQFQGCHELELHLPSLPMESSHIGASPWPNLPLPILHCTLIQWPRYQWAIPLPVLSLQTDIISRTIFASGLKADPVSTSGAISDAVIRLPACKLGSRQLPNFPGVIGGPHNNACWWRWQL